MEKLVASFTDEAIRDFSFPALLSETARESLRRSLEKRLGRSAEAAFSWFWKVFLTTPGLRTTNPEALEALFFARGVEAETLRFLDHFPGLRRVWIAQIADWRAFMADFFRHAAAFSENQEILEIAPDLSDPHGGGRTVLRVQFADATWFYKPRSGENEQAWFALLRWLNEAGFPKTFRLLEVFPRGDHSWMESAEHRPCENETQVAAFFFRAGALLYLVHRLGGIDLHCENLVACGENPVLIDCETLFHESESSENHLSRTGFLPGPRRIGQIGVSALAADVFGKQTPFLADRPIPAGEQVETIVAGFEEMHRFLNSEREDTFRQKAQAMAQLRWRKIQHATAFYAAERQKGLSPEALRREEASSLQKGDIPLFHGPGALDFPRWEDDAIGKMRDQIRVLARADPPPGYG